MAVKRLLGLRLKVLCLLWYAIEAQVHGMKAPLVEASGMGAATQAGVTTKHPCGNHRLRSASLVS